MCIYIYMYLYLFIYLYTIYVFYTMYICIFICICILLHIYIIFRFLNTNLHITSMHNFRPHMQIPLAPLWLHQSSKRRDSTMTAKNESHEALVAGFKYHFHPYLLGEMTQFDEQYFHMGIQPPTFGSLYIWKIFGDYRFVNAYIHVFTKKNPMTNLRFGSRNIPPRSRSDLIESKDSRLNQQSSRTKLVQGGPLPFISRGPWLHLFRGELTPVNHWKRHL